MVYISQLLVDAKGPRPLKGRQGVFAFLLAAPALLSLTAITSAEAFEDINGNLDGFRLIRGGHIAYHYRITGLHLLDILARESFDDEAIVTKLAYEFNLTGWTKKLVQRGLDEGSC